VIRGLVDLASATLGGEALACSDDFFASMSNLVKPEPAIFLPDEYTDRGKWMDGWESRRKRVAGHDWCILKLGVGGAVRAVDIDTAHFLGNHPPFASLEGSEDGESFFELVPQSMLRPGSHNLFVTTPRRCTHVRLNLFPDGGVARLRVYGTATPDLSGERVDLAALTSGGEALACSDAFFGPMHHLISPGRAVNMGGGWETKRRLGRPFDAAPDWILLRLGARGSIDEVELDTNHFKGNFAERVALDAIDAAGATITELLASDGWTRVLEPRQLEAHAEASFAVSSSELFTHVRLFVFPDGGVSRLRVWGKRGS